MIPNILDPLFTLAAFCGVVIFTVGILLLCSPKFRREFLEDLRKSK